MPAAPLWWFCSFIIITLVVASSLPDASGAKARHYEWEVDYVLWSPDCTETTMIGINGQFPGPTIRAKAGDTVVVKLQNSLHTEGLVIHWHGIRQYGPPWADGTASISQCAINPQGTFVYRFKVDKLEREPAWHDKPKTNCKQIKLLASDRRRGSTGAGGGGGEVPKSEGRMDGGAEGQCILRWRTEGCAPESRRPSVVLHAKEQQGAGDVLQVEGEVVTARQHDDVPSPHDGSLTAAVPVQPEHGGVRGRQDEVADGLRVSRKILQQGNRYITLRTGQWGSAPFKSGPGKPYTGRPLQRRSISM